MSRRHSAASLSSDARRYINRHFHILFRRTVYIALFATVQIAVLVWLLARMHALIPYFVAVCTVLSALVVMHIINQDSNPAYKIAWLIPILLLPIFGGLLYLMFGSHRFSRALHTFKADLQKRDTASDRAPQPCTDTVETLAPRDAALMSHYISHAGGCPPYTNTATDYYPSGEAFFAALCESLRSATRYIFMEYFIIEEGTFWDTVLEILTERAAAGVEVRVMYDDFGSMLTLPIDYDRTLHARGIRTHVFNPFNTVLSPRPNNRDHRKITVIDGKTAFVGGINLADEYINAKEKHGHWKDTALRLMGDGAWAVTLQFLCVWDADTHTGTDTNLYLPENTDAPAIENGIVQPYTDIPMDGEPLGESVYFQMITRAERYLYLTTPYLILDHEMITALQTAAKSGVDVRILTPHIPDKRAVFFLTRSYYQPLLDAGVRIYEYTPGFVHAKMMVSDDRFAVVGSINLDYRSLYLHLENAVWMYQTSAVTAVRDDILTTLSRSEEIRENVLGKMTLPRRLWLAILRTFAPLM